MKKAAAHLIAAVVLLGLLGACTAAADQPIILQAGPPGEAPRAITAAQAAAIEPPPHTPADVTFMQGMLHHHAQALEMTALVASNAAASELPSFAERMDISQFDEIALIQRWLEARGEDVPDVGAGSAHAHGAHGEHLMPGMLSAEEMAQLAAAEGVEFDGLFLDYMTRHHVGALQMVEELFERDDGSGQEPEIAQFAFHVNGDQQIEIDRMAAMRAALGEP